MSTKLEYFYSKVSFVPFLFCSILFEHMVATSKQDLSKVQTIHLQFSQPSFDSLLLQMHPKPLLSPLITIIILITILLLLTPKTQCSNDHKFEACAPQSCGNLSSIRYPFWIPNKQESYCGFPNPSFEIICKNQNPVLNISNDDYLITHIDYLNHTIHLANALVYDDNISCPTPLHNISLDRGLFDFPNDNYADFFLFYNCSSLPSALYMDFPISCAQSSTSNKNGTSTSYESFGYFHVELLEEWKYSVNNCQSMVVMPVDVGESDDNYGVSLRKMNYRDILRQGFTLNWTTSHDCGVCERSGGRCGFDHDRFSCFCRDKPHSKSCHDGKLSKRKDFIIGVCASSTFILLCILIFLYRRYRKKHPSSSLYASEGKSSYGPSTTSTLPSLNRSTYFGVQVFNYKELEKATDSFNPLKELGDGGFGTVYHGKLRDGREVAIKRLYENNQRRVDQFMNEVEILAHLRHKNLVTLYGCTPRQSHELLLVYEYVPNGTVADHLHGKQAKLGLLAWPKRLTIAIETASALVYLHATDIIHRDVKTQNILLDKDFSVKVADFGLSRLFPLDVTHVSTAPQGTPGYVDPEYHQCYHLTGKSDVYSFGVVLAELISSKPAVDITRPRQEINLSNMLINKIQNQAMQEFVDPSLGFESDSEANKEISAVAELAFRCLQSTRDVRPSMEEVLETLCNIKGHGNKDKADVVDIPADDVVMLKGELSPTSPPRDDNLARRYMPYASA